MLVGLIGVAAYAVGSRVVSPRRRSPSEETSRSLGHQVSTGTDTPVTSTTTTTPTNATPVDTQDLDPSGANLFSVPAVAAYLATNNDGLTAAVYDEVTGTTSVYRPDVPEVTASIMKVDILATMLAQGQADNTPFTADQESLATQMIEESDDNDAQTLWNAEGGATAVGAFDNQVGLTQTTPDAAGYWGLSTTTPADQLLLLKAIVYPNNVLSDESRDYELGLMTNVDPAQSWGISGGVAPGVTIAIKNGWLPLDAGGWQINSIGYVNGDGRNYLIAVMTNGNATEAQGIDTIQGLASLVWQALVPPPTATTVRHKNSSQKAA